MARRIKAIFYFDSRKSTHVNSSFTFTLFLLEGLKRCRLRKAAVFVERALNKSEWPGIWKWLLSLIILLRPFAVFYI